MLCIYPKIRRSGVQNHGYLLWRSSKGDVAKLKMMVLQFFLSSFIYVEVIVVVDERLRAASENLMSRSQLVRFMKVVLI